MANPLEWDIYGHECTGSQLYCPAIEYWLAGPFADEVTARAAMEALMDAWRDGGENVRWVVMRQRAPK